jgi:hypothetical protein
MYHPYIRQKIFEARARELERIAEDDRAAELVAAPPRRSRWSRLLGGRRRVAGPRSVRLGGGTRPKAR